eukprot:267956_1
MSLEFPRKKFEKTRRMNSELERTVCEVESILALKSENSILIDQQHKTLAELNSSIEHCEKQLVVLKKQISKNETISTKSDVESDVVDPVCFEGRDLAHLEKSVLSLRASLRSLGRRRFASLSEAVDFHRERLRELRRKIDLTTARGGGAPSPQDSSEDSDLVAQARLVAGLERNQRKLCCFVGEKIGNHRERRG